MNCSRREALYTIGMATAAAGLGCGCGTDSPPALKNGIAAMCGTNICFKLSDNPELDEPGGILLMKGDLQDAIVQRREDGTLFAMTNICTHAQCTVRLVQDKLICPCHGSQFDLTGKVLAPPAPKPLKSFNLVTNGDDITIVLA